MRFHFQKDKILLMKVAWFTEWLFRFLSFFQVLICITIQMLIFPTFDLKIEKSYDFFCRRMSLSYMEKRYHRGYFFLLRQKCFRGQPLPPRVVFTHERSEGCNWDPRGKKNDFSSLFFSGLFWPFFTEKGREGLKHPFLVQKRGGKFFSGGVGKHELGVGNYRQSGRMRHFL